MSEVMTVAESNAARFAALEATPASPEALGAVAAIAQAAWSQSAAGIRNRPSTGFLMAVGALVGDCTRHVASDPKGYLFLSRRASTFTGKRVGYRPFFEADKSLVASGYIEVGRGGHQQFSGFDEVGGAGGRGDVAWRKATRFRGTQALFDIITRHGVALDEWHQHFGLIADPYTILDPLVRRAASRQVGGDKEKGDAMPIDLVRDTVAAALHAQVVRINDYTARQSLLPDVHRGFRRIFNEGDQPGFAWNRGGRLTGRHGGYQRLPKRVRQTMTINGEAVAELDIRASHLTILHAMLGRPFDPSGHDPYDVPPIPRSVVKGWVTATLGHDRFHSSWPDKIAEKHLRKFGVPLEDSYPLVPTRNAILAALPVMAEWPDIAIQWFDLQYVESCIIMATVERLMREHDVPCYPVHDSVIVPQSALALAKRVLEEEFEAKVGVKPALTVEVDQSSLASSNDVDPSWLPKEG